MTQLTFIKSGDVYTDSLLIANELGRDHASIVYNIKKYASRISALGNLMSDARKIKEGAGRPLKIYYLNEAQAVFLATLMDNTEKVLDFKMKLAVAFVAMRKLLLEKQTADWQETRQLSKQVRLQETDAIKELVEYATVQGSKNSGKLYMVYSKLVKQTAGYSERDQSNVDILSQVIAFENILRGVIREEMTLNTHYKAIYQKAKVQLQEMKRLWSIPRLKAKAI